MPAAWDPLSISCPLGMRSGRRKVRTIPHPKRWIWMSASMAVSRGGVKPTARMWWGVSESDTGWIFFG
jgi:hypothetical protein